MSEPQNSTSPDFLRGVDFADLAEAGKLAGRVGKESILRVLSGEKVFAVGAHCTHYHAPLIDALAEDGILHCLWYHAVFDLATGEARHAPAFAPLSCWEVEREGEKIFVRKRRESISRASKI
ncbi:MAG: Rieske 2Fe-2S domain-containing protein [Methylocystis sp.]